MEIAVNINGRLTDAANAAVSPLDRGFLFGEGVYETLRTYNRHPFLLNRHLARLRASADLISLKVPHDDDEYRDRLLETMAGLSDKRHQDRSLIHRSESSTGIKPSY